MLKLAAILYPSLALWMVAQQAQEDPWSVFRQLGIGGAVAGVMYLWNRDIARQRDRFADQLEAQQVVSVENLHTIRQANEAHSKSADALVEATEVLRSIPSPEVWFRVVRALEDAEGAGRKMGG